MEIPSIGKIATSLLTAKYLNGKGLVEKVRLEDYKSLEPIILKQLENSVHYEQSPDWRSKITILNLGCGNSTLAEDLYDNGFTNVFNNDISSAVIQQMSERNAEKRPGLKCRNELSQV